MSEENKPYPDTLVDDIKEYFALEEGDLLKYTGDESLLSYNPDHEPGVMAFQTTDHDEPYLDPTDPDEDSILLTTEMLADMLDDGRLQRMKAVSSETVEVARRELDILIGQTDHPTNEYGDAMSPLARARKRITEMAEESHGDVCAGMLSARERIDEVGEETGAETSPIDPLQDDIFRALNELGGER